MHLFLDLDGTLTDSSPGITRCINHALTVLGREPATAEQLRGMIGRPLAAIFARVLASADVELLDRAIAAYRARFTEIGILENSVFPGIETALSNWRDAGHTLQVVTAKPTAVAHRVVTHFGLLRFFDAVHGLDLDGHGCDKADLVAAALRIVADDAGRAVMIGDHADDVRAARMHGVRAVAVGWGYGSRDELTAATPDFLAETVEDLVTWITTAND